MVKITNVKVAPAVGEYICASEINEYVRSPCPGLNVLANHGLINRNGRDIKVDDLVQAMYSCFALDPKIGRKEALKAAKKTGVVNLDELSFMKHDVCLVHEDYSATGNASSPSARLIRQFKGDADLNQSRGVTIKNLKKFRYARFSESIQTNKKLKFGFKQNYQGAVDCAMLYIFLKNLNMLDPKFVTQFLEEEKLPDNFKTPTRVISEVGLLPLVFCFIMWFPPVISRATSSSGSKKFVP
eukprot:gene25935-34538_t